MANPILGAYGATKAGLAYWNDAIRRELRGRGVSVSLVDLGPVSTEFFEAVRRRVDAEDDRRPLGIDPAPDALYNAMRDRPPGALTTNVEDAALRIIDLLEHPRRRLRVPRRVVWPFRLFGAILETRPRADGCGRLGDDPPRRARGTPRTSPRMAGAGLTVIRPVRTRPGTGPDQ